MKKKKRKRTGLKETEVDKWGHIINNEADRKRGKTWKASERKKILTLNLLLKVAVSRVKLWDLITDSIGIPTCNKNDIEQNIIMLYKKSVPVDRIKTKLFQTEPRICNWNENSNCTCPEPTIKFLKVEFHPCEN